VLIAVAVLLYISWRDLRSHRISNPSLILLAFSLLLAFGFTFHFFESLGILTLLTLSALRLSLGGGDIKLVAVLVLFGQLVFSIPQYLVISALIGFVQLVHHFIRRRTLKGEIALAPTICGPMLINLLISEISPI
jgi:prepilin peptidase CpaA